MTGVADRLAVSVVVATCDRPDRLPRALRALEAQTFSGEWEIVIVDDGSGPATAELLSEWSAAVGRSARTVLRTPARSGPGGARNVGWRAASGGLIAFTDDDCEPEPPWLEALMAASARAPVVLQGATAPNSDETARTSPFSRTLDVRSLGPWFPACNVAYPRDLLEALDGFDERFLRGEDTDLAWRAREAGAEFIWVPEARVRHAVMELGPIGKLRLALAWAPAFALYARHPELRQALHLGLFWKPSHLTLLLAFAGALAARRFPAAPVLALPYAYALRVRMAAEGGSLRHAPWYALHDALEIVSALRGSLRSGTVVL